MRSLAFKSIFSSFRDKSKDDNREKIYPLNKLQEILGFDDPDDLLDYCRLYGLGIIDENYVIMRSSSNSSCFKISKEDENLLKQRRSNTLVESKFAQRLNSEDDDVSNEKCLSLIISGVGDSSAYVPSEFSSGGEHVLQDSFSREGFYASDEIEQALIHAKQTYTTNMTNAAAAAATASNQSQVNVVKKLPRQAEVVKPSLNRLQRPPLAPSLFTGILTYIYIFKVKK